MRKLLMAAALLLAALPAFADSISFGGRLIVDGDGPGKVMEVAGKPDRIVQLETTQGGAAGERWEYYRDGKTILIEIHRGKVTSIIQDR